MIYEKFALYERRFHECCFLSIPKKKRRAIWELTHYCTRGCPYCFTSSKTALSKNVDYLNNNKYKIVDKFRELDVEDILLTGGEPLFVGKELESIINLIKKKGITYSLSTTGIPKKQFEKVINLEPRRVNLSYDPAETVPSKFWKSKPEILAENLDILSKKSIEVKITGVITLKNLNYITEYFSSLRTLVDKYDNISKIALTCEYPIGKAIYEEGISLNEINNLSSTYSTYIEDFPIYITMVNWPSLNSPLQICPAGKSIFSVLPNGDITACSLLYYLSKSFRLNSIIKDTAQKISDDLDIFHGGILRHIEEIKNRNKICWDCTEKNLCGGGCFAVMPVLMMDHQEKIICKYQPDIITDEQKLFFANIEFPIREDYTLPESSGKIEILSRDIEEEIQNFIKKQIKNNDLTHNFEHVEAVVELGKYIAQKEKANQKIVTIACYFHDASPRNSSMHHFHTFNSAKIAEEYLKREAKLSDSEHLHIRECIIGSSYGSYLLGIMPKSIEAKIVRDADFLDAIGARGVARVFAFAATHEIKTFGNVEYSPSHIPIVFEMNLTGPDKSPIHHFYTKLLKLKDLMLTETGKKIAAEKHKFMELFLKQYAKEINSSNGLQSSLDAFYKEI